LGLKCKRVTKYSDIEPVEGYIFYLMVIHQLKVERVVVSLTAKIDVLANVPDHQPLGVATAMQCLAAAF